MKARVKWAGERTFIGESGTGHNVLFGNPLHEGDRRPGPSPMEMLLIGTGGCSSFDVVHILERGREPVEGCEVEIEAERAETDPKVFTRLTMRFTVRGPGLDRGKVERAVALSLEKYCSAAAMMAKTATIVPEVVVIDTRG